MKEFKKCVDKIYLQDTFNVSIKPFNQTKMLRSAYMADTILLGENSIGTDIRETLILKKGIKHTFVN